MMSVPPSADGIRRAGHVTIAFSAQTGEAEQTIKRYLKAELYQSAQVMEVMDRAEDLVAALFARYWPDPEALPPDWRRGADDDQRRGRRIADFLAGMTDQFALAEYRRLFDQVPDFG